MHVRPSCAASTRENAMNRRNLAAAIAAAMLVAVPVAHAADTHGKAAKSKSAKSGTTTVHRSRGADGAVDATITGPHGGTTSVDRIRGSDGLTDRVVTGPNGATQSIDRFRGADGAVDATITGRKGGVTTIDRSRNADGTIDTTTTHTKP